MPRSKPAAEEIELDLGRYELRRRGRRVKLEKKSMELLIFLVARREQLVLREDIVAKLWRSDLFIDTERNINNIVRKIRTALGDDCDKPRFLETVVGKGYRFVGPLRVIDARHASAAVAESFSAVGKDRGAGWGERPSLAVLPLLLLGGAADDHGLCLGFSEALVSRLGNLQGVDVMPTSAVINLPTKEGPSEIASRLGVRFVVHGAIQSVKKHWRLSVEVFDKHSQNACFARKRDIGVDRVHDVVDEVAKQIASALNRPLAAAPAQRHPRYSKDPMAYAEFMRGYQLGSSGDAALLEEAAQRLTNAVTRDPHFALAHAGLSFVCATRHFEFDPASVWLEKAEFHCRRALELNPELAEGHVSSAFLLWGPSKNFQHREAIAELKRAIGLQKNLPHAYNRLGTILAHIGLLDHAREMYERGRPFHPGQAVSHSIVQVYVWNLEYDLALEEIAAWRAEHPGNKYVHYFAAQVAMMTGKWNEASARLNDALRLLPNDPLLVSLHGVYHALNRDKEQALDCMTRACTNPKSFGHAHHGYYQIACILALLGRREAGFEWLERSVSTGFACWPFFLKDPCLENLRGMVQFEGLMSSLQAKYPDELGLL